MQRVYFDNAATTPVLPEVIGAMAPYFRDAFGNPSSLHREGQRAMRAVDASREVIQKSLGAERFGEIVFASSATEANNLAIKGLLLRHWRQTNRPAHVITSRLEHESVLKPIEDMAALGMATVAYLPNDKNGVVNTAALQGMIRGDTFLVSVVLVASEVGTREPVERIADILRAGGKKVFFHADAAQALTTERINVQTLGVDLLTISAHKIHGPKGAAVLYARQDTPLQPILSGAVQESGLRASTENVPAIVGFAKAMELLDARRNETARRLVALRQYFLDSLAAAVPASELNGSPETSSPKIVNVYFPQCSAEELAIALDARGVAVSIGSACHARAHQPTPSVLALGYGEERATHSVRFSFGEQNTKEEVNLCIAALREVLAH